MFSFFILIEIFIFIMGLFVIFKKMALLSTESYCYSVTLVFAIYSLSIQIIFLLHLQGFFYIFDCCIFTFSLYQIWRGKTYISLALQELIHLYKQQKFILSLMICVCFYLFLQVLLLPPNNWDSMTYHLSRVLLFQQEGSLFLKNFIRNAQATYPWGYDILTFLFLRFLSYTIIVVATYALVNKFFNNTTLGLTTCFIILSLKEIILQATTTKNDIPCAAIAVICFLAGYNFYRSSKFIHLYIMIVALMFGVTAKSYFALFLLPFLFFYSFLLFKKFTFTKIMSSLISMKIFDAVLLILPAGLITCFMVNLGNNLIHYGNIYGETNTYLEKVLNHYGIVGCCLNMLRYLLQSIDPPLQFIRNILDNFHETILGKYQFIAVMKPMLFSMSWGKMPHEGYAWYGPLGFFLIIPSILFTALRGKGYIRLIPLSLLAFFALFSYRIVWLPHSGYFSLFFAGSGVCVAFLLQSFSKYKYFSYLRLLIVFISSVTLLYTSLFNTHKPFTDMNALKTFSKRIIELDPHYIIEKILDPSSLVFCWMRYAKDRTAYYDMQFTSTVVLHTFCNALESGKRVLLIGESETWVFPFLVKRPDLAITVARPDHIYLEGKIYNINEQKDYLFLKKRFDYLLCCTANLNEVISNSLQREKRLFYVPHTTLYLYPISLYEFSKNMQS
jgi:hypothetical protein